MEKPNIQTRISKINSFIIQFFILCEHQYFHCNERVQIFLLFFGELQVLNFITFSLSKSNPIIQIVELALHWVAMPHLVIFQLLLDYPGDGSQFFYIIVLLILMYIVIITTIIYFKTKSSYKSLQEGLIALQPFYQIQLYIIAFFGQFFSNYFILQLMDLVINSYKISNQFVLKDYHISHYINQILNIVALIMLYVFYLFRTLVTEESISIKIKGFEKLVNSVLQFFIFQFRVLIVIIYYAIKDNSQSKYIRQILVLSISLLTIFNIFANIPYSNKNKICTYLISSGILLTYSIIQIITQSINKEEFASLIFALLAPLTCKILLYFWGKYEELLILSSNKIEDPKILQFLLSQHAMYDYSREKTDASLILKIVIFHSHKETCENLQCSCQSIAKNNEPRNIIFMTEQIYSQQKSDLLKQFSDSIQEIKIQHERMSYFIHYLSALSLLESTTKAFQLSNLLISKSKKLYQNVQQQQQVFKEKNLGSHQTLNSKSSETFREIQVANQNQHDQQSQKRFVRKRIAFKNFQDLSFLQVDKANLIQQDIKNRMNDSFSEYSNADELSHSVTQFLDSEKKNNDLKNRVLELLVGKLAFFYFLQSPKVRSTELIFSKSKGISQKLEKLEQDLLNLFREFPSQKIQSVASFFQSEIVNNFLQAYRITNIQTISDETIIKKASVLGTYLIIGFRENELIIIQQSNLAYNFFGYSYEEFKKYTSISFLIPPAVKDLHSTIVDQFMSFGSMRYFRKKALNYAMLKNGFLQKVDFFFDITLNSNEFSFAAFFQKNSDQNSVTIFIDLDGKIGGATKNLFEKFGYRSHDTNKIKVKKQLYGIKVTQMIPDFYNLLQMQKLKLEDDKYQEQVLHINSNVFFIKKDYWISTISISTKQSSQQQKIMKNVAWNQPEHLNCYQASLKIHSRQVLELQYYIVEIEDIRQIRTEQNKTLQLQEELKQRQEDNNQLSLSKGNEDRWSQILQMSVQSEEKNINFPNAIELIYNDQVSNLFYTIQLSGSDRLGQQAITSKIIDQITSIKQQIQKPKQIGFNQIISSNRMISPNHFGSTKQIHSPQIQTPNIFSPNQSISGLAQHQQWSMNKLLESQRKEGNFTKNQEVSKQNQKFFNAKSLSSVESKNQEEIIEKIYQIQKEVDKELENDVLQQLQMNKSQEYVEVDDRGSQVSSFAGVRKSPLFKKYEILDTLILSKKQSVQFKLMSAMLALMFVFSSIYTIILLANLGNDLERFLTEIDLLQLTYSFMGPLNAFMTTRFTINNYQTMNQTNLITLDEMNFLLKFPRSNLDLGYDDFKTNFVNQLTNPYLNQFFEDQYLIISFMQENLTRYYSENITLRSALHDLIECQYRFKVAYKFNLPFLQSPFLAFSYLNFFNFTFNFRKVNKDIYDYTLQRNYDIQAKWNAIWYPFIILSAIFTALSWYFFRLHLNKYERIMNFYKYADKMAIDKDIERYKLLISILTKDADVMFKYNFDIDQKEKFLQQKKDNLSKKQLKQENQNQLIQKFQLPLGKSIICYCIIYGIFAGLSFTLNQQTQDYLTKFRTTQAFYQLLSDLGYRIPCMYTSREMKYRLHINFPFYTDEREGVYLIQETNGSFEAIKEFFNYQTTFQPENFLVDQSFADLFQLIKETDICKYLPEAVLDKCQFYCDVCYDGVLRRGMYQALNQIMNAFNNEMQIDNYGNRTHIPKFELEASFMITNVIRQLSAMLKSQLLLRTTERIDLIIAISLAYLSFAIASMIMLFTFIRLYFFRELQTVKRFIFLMPTQTLFIDDQFERNLRVVIMQDNLI